MSIAFIAGVIVILVIVAIAVAQRSRPRITTIVREKDRETEGDEP